MLNGQIQANNPCHRKLSTFPYLSKKILKIVSFKVAKPKTLQPMNSEKVKVCYATDCRKTWSLIKLSFLICIQHMVLDSTGSQIDFGYMRHSLLGDICLWSLNSKSIWFDSKKKSFSQSIKACMPVAILKMFSKTYFLRLRHWNTVLA